MNDLLNNQTISDFQRGDEKVFRQLFDHYYHALTAFCFKLTGSWEEGEDISLRCFQSLYSRCQSFQSEVNIKAFLFISARNSCLNYLKSRQRDRQRLSAFAKSMSDDTLLEYEFSIKIPLVAAIEKAIDTLPEECRKIFKLLYYEEQTPGQLAEKLNISVSTVYNQKSRALHVLRIRFSENALVIAVLLEAFTVYLALKYF